ncbi:DUF397 domain-containing protein [Streptomyces chengbuensis]|uniref:DUF397 domain-containing protein n=1 Tax=Streptomyces TaxID=1883 RepID=UPI0025B461BD|nr:DUF397 domain-containing protein [Streptomyces sp. HUAS CB01]WJY51051.1 DUF397 domain-containing protein [Streptomyces sp. HUAS CB01]
MNPDLVWFKSSYSDNEGGACPHTVHVRDSKVPSGPMLTVAPAAWAAFVATTAAPRPAR